MVVNYVMGRCPACSVWIACSEQLAWSDAPVFIGECPCGATFEVDWTGEVVNAG